MSSTSVTINISDNVKMNFVYKTYYSQKTPPWVSPRSVRVGYVVVKVALGQIVLRMIPSPPPGSIVPPMLHTHSFTYHRHYNISAIGNVVKQRGTKTSIFCNISVYTTPFKGLDFLIDCISHFHFASF